MYGCPREKRKRGRRRGEPVERELVETLASPEFGLPRGSVFIMIVEAYGYDHEVIELVETPDGVVVHADDLDVHVDHRRVVYDL